jgi:predicted enzyme related to lactoylglutathione lyase
MGAPLAHFAINADDVEVARQFYGRVFGWSFRAWGPPGFFQIDRDDGGPRPVIAALQQRRELVDGRPILGFECTFAVDDVDDTAARVVEAGGRLVMEKTTITGVGDLIWIEDPAGNIVGAMRYDTAAE